MNRRFLYYPFVLAALVFALDRLAGIPAVLQLGRNPPSEMETLAVFIPRELSALRQAAGPVSRRVVFIGSSRSIGFASVMPEAWRADSLLSAPEKRRLDNYRFSSRLSVARKDLLSMLATVDAITQAADRPDGVVLEFSPYMLYGSLLARDSWYRNVYTDGFMVRRRAVLPADLRADLDGRRIFATYNAKWKPERAFTNWRTGSQIPTAEETALLYALSLGQARQHAHMLAVAPDALDARTRPIFELSADVTFQGIFMAPDLDMQFRPLVNAMVSALQARGIPVVLWLPAVHPMFMDRVYRVVDRRDRFFSQYIHTVRNTGAPFYNAYEILPRCNLWDDASHLSVRCYQLLTHELVRCLEAGTASCNARHFQNPLNGRAL